MGVGGRNSGVGRREGGDGVRGLKTMGESVGEVGRKSRERYGVVSVELCVGCKPLDQMEGRD